MNLVDVVQQFKTEDDCLAYLETRRWPDGKIRCITCGCDRIGRIIRKASKKNKRTRSFQCMESTCRQQFSVTAGTIYDRSHLPLTKWFMAIAIMVDARKGISARQMQKHLGIRSYKSAWYLCHRIRKSMEALQPTKMTGVVEADETFVGGRAKRRRSPNHTRTAKFEMVFALRERNTEERPGQIRFFHVPDGKATTIRPILERHLRTDVKRIVTDESSVYPFALDRRLKGRHRTVNHSVEWVSRDGAHTNTVESAFSLFKRGVIGSFHWISRKHLHRYLSEFECRFNRRWAHNQFGMVVQDMAAGRPMPYRQLTSPKA